jgi:hypothetical protein
MGVSSRQAEVAQHRKSLRGKHLLEFDHVHLTDRQSGAFEHLARRGCGGGEGILVGATDAEVLRHIVGRLRHGINTEGRLQRRVHEAPADGDIADRADGRARAAIAADRGAYRMADELSAHAIPPDLVGFTELTDRSVIYLAQDMSQINSHYGYFCDISA